MTTYEDLLRSLQPKKQFTLLERQQVWEKGQIVAGYDPTILRKDACGAWMRWFDYGKTDSQNGWEIDHIYPESKGGGNQLSNLQPLHWQNNRSKGDSLGLNYCAVWATV
jgi:hypothetical protein